MGTKNGCLICIKIIKIGTFSLHMSKKNVVYVRRDIIDFSIIFIAQLTILTQGASHGYDDYQ